VLRLVFALSKFLDHFLVEGFDVVGLAARQQPHVGDRFFIDPIPTGITDIRAN